MGLNLDYLATQTGGYKDFFKLKCKEDMTNIKRKGKFKYYNSKSHGYKYREHKFGSLRILIKEKFFRFLEILVKNENNKIDDVKYRPIIWVYYIMLCYMSLY